MSNQIKTYDDLAHNLGADLFGQPEVSNRIKQELLKTETARLRNALNQLVKDERELRILQDKQHEKHFYRNLRKLEGAEPDGPHNFVWRLDFPHVLSTDTQSTVLDSFSFVNKAGGQGELVGSEAKAVAGFDIVVGNPPFVTPRNRTKRELYAGRWPDVCYKNYQLVCPFFERSFGLLKPRGELGFIVSNAFAKRDFGRPLVERFFPRVELQKIIDCSGLLFPGHGTPTCLIFGSNNSPLENRSIRVAATLPGGGDLRTAPEESPLWHSLATQNDNPGYSNTQITVLNFNREELQRWPWNFVGGDKKTLPDSSSRFLSDICREPIGAQFITGRDDAFVVTSHYMRRNQITGKSVRPYASGEDVRNWSVSSSEFMIFPYDRTLKPLKEPLPPEVNRHPILFRESLENSVVSGSTKKKDTNLLWFEFRRLARAKFEILHNIVNPHVATHCHFVVTDHTVAFKEKALAIALRPEFEFQHQVLIAGWLNSSYVLDLLKKECFNKGAGEDEHRDRFEFAGGKLETIRLPGWLDEALRGKSNPIAEQLCMLANSCLERGAELSALALKKLFEKSGEAYDAWNATLPGYVPPHATLDKPFVSATDLQDSFVQAMAMRNHILAEMVSCQEEIDWLIYSASGLLGSENSAAAAPINIGHYTRANDHSASGQPRRTILPEPWNSYPPTGPRLNAIYGRRDSPISAITNKSAASSNRSISAVGRSNGRLATAGWPAWSLMPKNSWMPSAGG